MKKLAIVASLALALGTSSAFAATQQEAAHAILEAVKMNNKADSLGFEWRDTYKKVIGPAKEAYHKGEYDKAIELANKAKAEAELGIQQAESQPVVGLRMN